MVSLSAAWYNKNMNDEELMTPGHYYGDIVRKLFLAGAIIVILVYPFFSSLEVPSPFIPAGSVFMITAIVLLAILAGLTSWRGRWTAALDVAVSLFEVVFFEDHAITFVKTPPIWIFLTDQLLALIFITALYFSVRNLRGMLSRKR